MPDFDRNMTGVLFKNDNKSNPRWPDYKGQCEIEGKTFWLSAWIKEGKKSKFLSLAFKEQEADYKPKPKKQDDFVDSEPPF